MKIKEAEAEWAKSNQGTKGIGWILRLLVSLCRLKCVEKLEEE